MSDDVLADRRTLPAAVADLRGDAVLEIVARAQARFDWRAQLALRGADIPSAYLPYAIRGAAIQDYADPAFAEATLRGLLANALLIKVREGSIKGVTYALSLIGVSVASWVQWHERVPRGAPGTHTITVSVSDTVFAAEGRAYTQRLQRRIARIVAAAKRHSQDVAVRFASASEAPVFVGVLTRSRVRIVPSGDPITQLIGTSSLYLGAVVSSRVRVIPGA